MRPINARVYLAVCEREGETNGNSEGDTAYTQQGHCRGVSLAKYSYVQLKTNCIFG